MASSVDVPATIHEDDALAANSFLGETTESSLILRGCTMYITERSLRRTISLLILVLMLLKNAQEKRCAGSYYLLSYLRIRLLNKVKATSICIFVGDNAKKNHVVEDSEETKEEETNREIQEVEDSEENKQEEKNREIQEVRQVQHVTITDQENQEIEEVHEDEHEAPSLEETTENQGVKEENIEVHEDEHEAAPLEETTTNLEVKGEKTEEEKDLQLLKRRSDWWVNTRNVMAMVAIFFATVSITGSFTPPANVMEVKFAAIIFSVAIHICLMLSMSVLFFLFGVTSTSPSIEIRIFKLANLGLWISFFSLTAAYLVNIWVSIIYKELKICLIISTCVVFTLLASFLFSAKFRAVFGGVKVLKETDDDVKPTSYMRSSRYKKQMWSTLKSKAEFTFVLRWPL